MKEFQRLPMIHTNTYIKFHQHLDGVRIWSLKSVDLTVENILNDPEGLFACEEMLKSNKISYLEWEKKGRKFFPKLKERHITEEELLDCIKYALFKPLINLLNLNRVETNNTSRAIELALSNKRFYLLKYKNVLLEYEQLKRKKCTMGELETFKYSVILFLNELKEFIRNYEGFGKMYEIESVYVVDDLNVVKQKLLNTNHLFIKREKEVAVFLVNGDKLIRLKITSDKTTVSFKGGKFGGAREEIEYETKEFQAPLNMFLKIGFEVETHFMRSREHYTTKDQNITITLDETKGSPKIVEIEKITDDEKKIKEIRVEIEKCAALLGLKNPLTKEEFKKSLDNYKKKNKTQIHQEEVARFLKNAAK